MVEKLFITAFFTHLLESKIYDPDGFWLRAAAVCIRDDSESEVDDFIFI